MEVRPKAEAPPVSMRPPGPIEAVRRSIICPWEVMEQEGMAIPPPLDVPLQSLSQTE
jgi:hypothetical protein